MRKQFFMAILLNGLSAMAQQHQIPFKIDAGSNLMVVKAVINGSYSRNFLWDTGASSIVINEGLYHAMVKNGDLSKHDVLGKAVSTIADGSQVSVMVISLKSFTVGSFTANNIEAIVMPGSEAPFLLGQTFFKLFSNTSIDSNKKLIELQEGKTNPQAIAGLDSVRIIACSYQKQGEISSIKKNLAKAKVHIGTISEENNIPPQKAIDRIQGGEYVVRYFDTKNFNEAKEIRETLEKYVKGQVILENMLRYYSNPISDYVEIWLK